MFFDSNTNTDIQLNEIKRRLITIDTSLLALRAMLLESERNRVGLTSDEDYKQWLNTLDKPTWDLIKINNKIMEEQNHE